MTEAVAPSAQPAQLDHEPVYRRNSILLVADGVLFIVAMNIIGSTTVIPDFIRNLTKSEVLIGLSSSMFDILWTLPQLFVARYIVQFERKKWWFVGPSIPVRFIILIFGIITIALGKEQPQAILIAFLFCYGIAALGDGMVGVPWADLLGTSMNERWRARTFGLMTALSGLVMLGLSAVIGRIIGSPDLPFPNNYALLFIVSGVLFVLSILPILLLRELPGGKGSAAAPPLREFLPLLGKVLRTNVPFRAMVATRMLTSLFTMAGPFYIGYATVKLGLSSSEAVPGLLAMQTIGGIAGSFVYTWLGARSNILYIRLALGCAALLPISALLTGVLGPQLLYFGFLMSGLSLSNLFLSYQNWVVTHADTDQRPVYVGLFNTIAATISLLSPLIGGTIAQNLGYEPLFVVSLLMVGCALFVALRYIRK